MKLREWMSRAGFVAAVVALLFHAYAVSAQDKPSMQAVSPKPQQLVIIDTDIGDDIDDVFAVGLALSSPELDIFGITSAWGDTALKSRLLDRLLCETGRSDIPVATGIAGKGTFTQARWAERQPDKPHADAVSFLLDQIQQHPGEITLIGRGPLTNIGAAIRRVRRRSRS
jgi:purine nucleosidase